MLDFIFWYLTLSFVALAALPLGWTWFRDLPDRGWGLLRPLGLLLLGFGIWFAGSFGFLKLGAGSGMGGLLLLFMLGIAVLQRWGGGWRALRDWLRTHWRLVLLQEILFLVVLIFWTWYRVHDGLGISHTEQPMDFAFMNAIRRGGEMPPNDPWLSGFAISYYYMGYLIMAQVGALSGVASGVAYNLAFTSLAALAAGGAFSLTYNLLATADPNHEEAHIPQPWALGAASLAVILLLGVSNLTGVLTMSYHAGYGPDGLYNWLAVNDLTVDPGAESRPALSGWWWWKASRTLSDYNPDGGRIEVIDEFPFFSFLLGDMHPHVLALPFTLLGLSVALNAFKGVQLGSSAPRRWRWAILPPESWAIGETFGKITLFLTAVFVGAFAILNTWDLPTQGALLAMIWLLAILFGSPANERRSGLIGWLSGGALLLLSAVLLYLPFYIGFRSQANGIRLVPWSTLPQHYLLMFGLFLFVLVPLILSQGKRIWEALRSIEQRLWLFVVGMWVMDGLILYLLFNLALDEARLALLVAAFWLLIPFTLMGLPPLADDDPTPLLIAQVAGFPFLAGFVTLSWTQILTAFLLLITLLAIWARVRALLMLADEETTQESPKQKEAPLLESLPATQFSAKVNFGEQEKALLFALILTALAFLLTMGSELFYIKDGFPGRMNTIFKLYYQAWVLMAMASAFGLIYLAQRLPLPGRILWLGSFSILTLACMWYPIQALPAKANFDAAANWDGRFWMTNSDPDRFAAIEWLNAQPGQVVILEKAGGAYNATESALSGWTGHSTLLGWRNHEGQWRGDYDEIGRRDPIIQQIYQSTDVNETQTLLDEWEIDYVALTPLEIGEYNLAGRQIEKFREVMTPVFEQGNVVIFGR